MWELDCEESWEPKNWCFWAVVLEKTLESPSDCKEIQLVHSKGDQSWVFIGRTDAEADMPIFWPPDVKSWLIGKDSDAGRHWRQEEKGTREDEMALWPHQLDEHEFEWTPGVGDGQGGLACCDSWGHKELDTTEWLKWTELKVSHASKVMLKILQARLQQYVNHEFPYIQAGFRKGREEPEIKLPTSAGSWKKQESSRKTSISALLTMQSLQLCGSHPLVVVK